MAMQKITKGYPNWDVPYNENVEEYNNTIGNVQLDTEDKTIKGAINEVKNNLDNIKENEQINAADISNLKTSVAQNTSSLKENTQNITTLSKIENVIFTPSANITIESQSCFKQNNKLYINLTVSTTDGSDISTSVTAILGTFPINVGVRVLNAVGGITGSYRHVTAYCSGNTLYVLANSTGCKKILVSGVVTL